MLKPVIVFDLDGTLLGSQNPDTLECKGIAEMMFVYNAIDYMVNDPPEGDEAFIFGGMRPRPVDIFFLTARQESDREVTVQNLSKLFRDAPSSINKRLIFGNYLEHPSIYDAKTECIKKLEAKGYTPVLVFEDDRDAMDAYLHHNPDILVLMVNGGF